MSDKPVGPIKHIVCWLVISKDWGQHGVEPSHLLLVMSGDIDGAIVIELQDGIRCPAHSIRLAVKKFDYQFCCAYTLTRKNCQPLAVGSSHHPLELGVRYAVEHVIVGNKKSSAGESHAAILVTCDWVVIGS
jgi:hypothetical protein